MGTECEGFIQTVGVLGRARLAQVAAGKSTTILTMTLDNAACADNPDSRLAISRWCSR